MVAEFLSEVIYKLIPIRLELLAPVALLHEEVEHNKAVLVLLQHLVELVLVGDFDALGVVPPLMGLVTSSHKV